jgi:AcrR family transcriptional regulator
MGSRALMSVNEDTRDRLLDAAQELFAQAGSWTTPLARVVRAAGQRNQSAIQYHFGSREELIYALIERDRAREMQERQARLDRLEVDGGTCDLRTAVAALVLPSCATLTEPRGRRLRMIIADVARGIGDDQLADPRPPDLARTIRLIEAAMPPLPRGARATRIAAALRLLIEMTAARARTIEAGQRPLVGARSFERDLLEMLHSLLSAPRP